jgi:uncharacterized protein (TIGR02271 family)
MSGNDGSSRADGPSQRAAWVEADASADEVRIGEARLVRGRATVSTFTDEAPAPRESFEASGRVLSDSEIAQSGLLKERVIEIGETREEAVVSKQAVVREELVVSRDVEERTERIADTVRRTEVDIERLGPDEEADREGTADAEPAGTDIVAAAGGRELRRVGKH